MARTSTYLNFSGNTEEAFAFYKGVFGTDYIGEIHRIGDAPPLQGGPELAADVKNMIMHVSLPITGGHVLMGTDAVESLGHVVTQGNNVHLNLEPDTREEADRLFEALAEGGRATTPMQDMFWGAYYGAVTDRFGMHWMLNVAAG